MHLAPNLLGAFQIVLSAAGFATMAIFVKFAYAAGANLVTILSFRFSLAAVFFILVLYRRGVSLRLNKKMTLSLLAMGGLGYGSTSAFFAGSLHYLPASLSAMLLYTFPAIVSLLSFLTGEERFTRVKGAALAVCLVGLILTLGVSFANISLLGILLGLAAAVTYSVYIVIGNRLLKNTDTLLATGYICSAAAIVYTATGLATASLQFSLPYSAWASIVAIAVFPTIVGILFFFAGLKKIGPTSASIISTLEPAITVLLSILLLGEHITLLQLAGGILVLCGVILLQCYPDEKIMVKK